MTFGKHVRLLVRMALRQVRARKGLSAVAAGGVMLGVLTLVVTSSLLWGAKIQFEAVILDVSPEVSLEDRELILRDHGSLVVRDVEGLRRRAS